MREKSRRRKALLISASAHLAMLFCWGWFAAPPREVLTPEDLVKVELMDDLSQAVTERRVVDVEKTPRQDFKADAVQERHGGMARQATKKTTASSAGNGAAQVDGSGIAGSLDTPGAGLEEDRDGWGAVGDETPSEPAPGSLGFSRAEPMGTVKPIYPEREAQSGVSGICHVRVEVLADGSAGVCEIAQGSGSAALDQSALSAARQYRFAPARDLATGEAVKSSVVLPVRFDSPEAEEEGLW